MRNPPPQLAEPWTHKKFKPLKLSTGAVIVDRFTKEVGLELIEKHYELGLGTKLNGERCSMPTFLRPKHGYDCSVCSKPLTHFIVLKMSNVLKLKPCTLTWTRTSCWEILITADHIIPDSLGGTDHSSNIRATCQDCNSTRGNQATLAELIDSLYDNKSGYNPSAGVYNKGGYAKFFKRMPMLSLAEHLEKFEPVLLNDCPGYWYQLMPDKRDPHPAYHNAIKSYHKLLREFQDLS